MLGYGQFTLETCCGYGYNVTWTFLSPGWPQAVENSLGTVRTLPGAPDGFSGMGYISTLGALWHPSVPLWIWASEFISSLQLVKSSRDHKPVRKSLLFRTDWPQFNSWPSTSTPHRPSKGPLPLLALLGTPNLRHDLQGTTAPTCLRRDFKSPLHTLQVTSVPCATWERP